MAPSELYAYVDYRAFLRDWFKARKAANPRFSHRAFARRAGQRSPSLLLHVIEGKRNLTAATCEAFARAVGFSDEEYLYFTALVDYDQATTADERARAWERISATRRYRDAARLQDEQLVFLSAWHHAAIHELASCPGFVPDAERIAAQLRHAVSASEARASLELLKTLGMLVSDEAGTLRPAAAALVTSHEGVAGAARAYHAGALARASVELGRLGVDQRHFGAVTAAVPETLLPRLKREVARFQERILDLCEGAEGERAQVVQFNVHFVTVSEPVTGGGGA
ncbi:MAG: hypothetical protein RLZZ299_2329 [Pseudomonadota bacterium]|jgi:uncharacterized protein (TIGR02147 family)